MDQLNMLVFEKVVKSLVCSRAIQQVSFFVIGAKLLLFLHWFDRWACMGFSSYNIRNYNISYKLIIFPLQDHCMYFKNRAPLCFSLSFMNSSNFVAYESSQDRSKKL